MTVNLKERFSIIRNRKEVLEDIHSDPKLLSLFYLWTEEQKELFLEYCTGVRGIKLLYDQYFKALMNPIVNPARLEMVLSALLQENVKILQVLPNESARIAAEKSLLVLDVVVELEDGRIANVEVQKIGYKFPGERSACYSADLLMRQYKRMKEQKQKKFRYSDIKKVYSIVLFEKSTQEFHEYKDIWFHKSEQKTNTGLKLELLQEYVFIPLDIFKDNLHNNNVDIKDKLVAWLIFLSVDEPEWIIKLIQTHPEFEELYLEVYTLCRNTEVMMGLFSEELLELDKNTVEYMIDEMQNIIDEKEVELQEKEVELQEKDVKLQEKDVKLHEKDMELLEKNMELQKRDAAINEQKELIEFLKAQLAANGNVIK